MGRFLRENWIFILVPVVIVAIALVVLIVVADDSPSNFIYNIF